MIRGMSGSLLSHDALERLSGSSGKLSDDGGFEEARRTLRAWHVPLRAELGPATSARVTFDRLAVPMWSQFGYRVLPAGSGGPYFRAVLDGGGGTAAVLLVTAWGCDLSSAWRDAVRHGIAQDARWCFCMSGPALRVVDSRRTYSRRFVEFDIETASDNERTFAVLWGLLRAEAMRPAGSNHETVLDRAIELSEAHRAEVRGALQHGVRDALLSLVQAFSSAAARKPGSVPADGSRRRHTFDESLVVVYRILFLLFAEARGMVPRWHPLYRDAYTIEALCEPAALTDRPPGLWEALQAIARLAHRGCRFGSLRVTPFNGRLFSPSESPLADTLALDDGAVRCALVALTTRPSREGRRRIAFGDLGVEQLGGVYERLLDYDIGPVDAKGAALVRTERRKATGSFYTPRALTEYVVRRTLAPLVQDASPERILALRVLDPAMGSGAFLVAACRYLAAAYEAALIRESALPGSGIDEHERAAIRRTVAQRCLYGVDLNPMAVQLARLSLWLATLAADRPLTFLDHHLRAGNSLVGATIDDIARQPPARGRRRGETVLPLFPEEDVDAALQRAVGVRMAIAAGPGDTLEQVRAKERALVDLSQPEARLSRWKAAADLWCATWFSAPADRRTTAGAFAGLVDTLLDRAGQLPPQIAGPLLDRARRAAAGHRFFHWTLEFPEAFYDEEGRPLDNPGFDAIIGNPPWEMLRGDRGPHAVRASRRADAAQLTDFVRGSGTYRLQGDGHSNLYQLFTERSLSLLRTGGRLGVVLPSGLATDRGSARLRRVLLDRATVDTCLSIENRDGVFPIHRGVRFLVLAASTGGCSASLPCRFGIRRIEMLDTLPDVGSDPAAVVVSRALLDRLGGPDLAIPEFRTPTDLRIASAIAFAFPSLGGNEWGLRFGRELNATDDRKHFVPAGRGLPVVEGKLLTPFRTNVAAAPAGILPRVAARLLDPGTTFRRARLAYRDVAASTNRCTLIAGIVPAGVVTTHTLFCLKTPVDIETQRYLCGMLNSFVANYLVRMRVNTHVSVAIIEQLPVPKPARSDPRAREIAALSAALAARRHAPDATARLQGAAAGLYGLDRAQFAHVLESFPLVPGEERQEALRALYR
ncbi:MAG TPA: N-6 DNA methylase [Vicinamibacterales bacterium]|nr:N-6 DNA methylase [Vicinamibacterales bacterium]